MSVFNELSPVAASLSPRPTVVGAGRTHRDVHDAVLIEKRGDGLEVQTWRDRAPGFTELHAYHDQKPIDLLLPLAPAKAPELPPITFPNPPHLDTTPWYAKRWVQASAVSVVVVGIVGALMYATREQSVNWGANPGLDYGGPTSPVSRSRTRRTSCR